MIQKSMNVLQLCTETLQIRTYKLLRILLERLSVLVPFICKALNCPCYSADNVIGELCLTADVDAIQSI